ncbi:DUF4189 domain-containing protein [Nocardia sp. NPDC059240]|uniref:DUF4189 domain-containing protein n=1 Tax=Nocardia sp. NPDC059240 TaxID=3346786 RepID=UPI0036B21C0C
MSGLAKSAIFVAAAATLTVLAAPAADAGVVYYGSIAYADNGSWGIAANYRDQARADRDAINECGGTRNCSTKLQWTNGCGSLVIGNDGPSFKGVGTGATREEAEQNAFDALHKYTFLPPVGSAAGMHDVGHVAATECNG